MTRREPGDRAKFYNHTAMGSVEKVLNGGLAYVFRADSGATFTCRHDELTDPDGPDRQIPGAASGTILMVDGRPK